MDGCFKVGEYIREGFKFTKFHNNLVAMGSLITNFSTVLQVYNIYDMPTIFRYAEKMNVKVLINYMYDPTFLKVEILNKEERNKVLDYYKSINFYDKRIFKILEENMEYYNLILDGKYSKLPAEAKKIILKNTLT